MRSDLRLGEIREATGGTLLRGSPEDRAYSFSTDTRSLTEGDLFLALRGPYFDGHDFIATALDKRARGAIISAEPRVEWNRASILLGVEDTLFALGEIARLWRRLHPIPLVAVTGSSGKTTVKEWTAQLLLSRYHLLRSFGTHNNLIGVPLTVLQLRGDHQLAVLELGMNAPGEIRRLSEICQPDVGVITNIGPAHLEFLGSLEGIAAAKAEVLPFLDGEKVCILNGDDPYLEGLKDRVRGRRLTYGLASRCDLRASGITMQAGGIAFQMAYGGGGARVTLPVWGRHNVHNALAAAAVGIACGLGLEEIREGLETVRQPSMRLERTSLPGGIVLLNDAYNANPMSTRAALQTFFEMKGSARGILVLGDMLELGPEGERLHREIGGLISRCDHVGALIAVGPLSRVLAEEAQREGLSAPIVLCEDQKEAACALRKIVAPGDWILLKGSRAMKMELVLEGLS